MCADGQGVVLGSFEAANCFARAGCDAGQVPRPRSGAGCELRVQTFGHTRQRQVLDCLRILDREFESSESVEFQAAPGGAVG